MLGIESGIGIDVDPCAVAEAKANLRLNGLEGRVFISDAPAESISGSFALIAANLRLPTLLCLAPSIAGWASRGTAVVISGIRLEEAETLLSVYKNQSFVETWRDDEDDWMGLALRKEG